MRYATDTSVSVGKSKEEIETMISRSGGHRFASLTEPGRAVVSFELAERRIQFELVLPHRDTFAVRHVRGKRVASDADRQQREWEQACRSRWRALALAIKAKLVAVGAGVETLEQAFLAHVVVPTAEGARQFGDVARPALEQAYSKGRLPPLLGDGR